MARVQNVHPNGEDLFVPKLDKIVEHGDVVDVDDDDLESWVPSDDKLLAQGHPWAVVEGGKSKKRTTTKKEA